MINRIFVILNLIQRDQKMRGRTLNQPMGSQKGSVILIVLMLLVLMSIIGISSTNITVTESFIVRNTGIRKQNIHLVDAAASEFVQILLDAGLDDTASLEIFEINPQMPNHMPWINDTAIWFDSGNLAKWYNPDTVGRVLDTTNSAVPASISNEMLGLNYIELIDNRGEWDGDPDNSPIRSAMVGWNFKLSGGGNLNLAAGQPVLRTADILTEYVSENNGIIRLSMGVEREFMF